MKKIIIIAMAFSMFFICSCGRMSTANLQKHVKTNMEETLQKRLPDYKLKVDSVTLFHDGGDKYHGVAEVTAIDKSDGSSENVSYVIDVTYDGNNFMWKIVE